MLVRVSRIGRVGAVLAAVVVSTGCAEKLASLPRPTLESCGGLFTTVALPPVSRDEQRALEGSVPQLSSHVLDLQLRRNYYRILYEEQGGAPGPARETYVAT